MSMAQTVKRGLTYYALLAALPRAGCPICRVRAEGLERFFFWFTMENYAASELITELNRAGGFCAIHARVLTSGLYRYVGSVTAQYVLTAERIELEQVQARLNARYRRRRANRSRQECPACARAAEDDEHLARVWVEALAAPDFRQQLETSEGLCLPHLRRVIDYAPADMASEFLQNQIDQLKRLEAELNEYFRKIDYRFADEPKGVEQTAWQRTWERLTGWPLDRLTDINDTQ
jgi:hypothetical protein